MTFTNFSVRHIQFQKRKTDWTAGGVARWEFGAGAVVCMHRRPSCLGFCPHSFTYSLTSDLTSFMDARELGLLMQPPCRGPSDTTCNGLCSPKVTLQQLITMEGLRKGLCGGNELIKVENRITGLVRKDHGRTQPGGSLCKPGHSPQQAWGLERPSPGLGEITFVIEAPAPCHVL